MLGNKRHLLLGISLYQDVNFNDFENLPKVFNPIKPKQITIIYSPGRFPYFKDSTPMFGGIPQKANFTAHVTTFIEQVNKLVPLDFKGYAVLDFEAYQPNYEIVPAIYKKASEDWIRSQYPTWGNETIKFVAGISFNQATEVLFELLLQTGRDLRPGAKWGYYHYPYCRNFAPDSKQCIEKQMVANNLMAWLFQSSGALYPSVYLSNQGFDSYANAERVKLRIKETKRINRFFQLPVLPYMRFKYVGYKDTYLQPLDLWSTLGEMWYNRLEGAIIWGSKSDVEDQGIVC
ncbi:Hyaluronidase [Armadillidium nasatum]|uniref:Hyaluronidase n=1 Tax=Armadillidium nasatum TaxID=96803 RepID=A0A5N5TJL6_9CRUS|nr:Hyaluronidase [Armadillidium nasatum]